MKKAITKIKANIAVDTKIVLAVMMVSTAALGLSFAAATFQLPTDKLDRTIKVVKPYPMFTPSISEAKVNVGFTELDSDVQAGLHASQINANFVMDGVELGSVELIDNIFIQGSTYEGNRVSPLALYYTTENEMADISYLPSHIFRVIRGDYDYTLCVPETVVYDSNTNISNANTVYYFDSKGTPYFDKNLSQAALPKSCPQLLANALKVSAIPSASPNLPIEWGIAGQDLIDRNPVYASFIRNATILASLDLNRPEFNSYNTSNRGNDPLAISISSTLGGTNSPHTTQSRVIYIGDQYLDNIEYQLCLPELYFDGQFETNTLFFDKYGTPYLDSLLRHRAMNETCSQILNRALVIEEPVFAYGNPNSNFEVYFLRTGGEGVLDLSNNEFWPVNNPWIGDWGADSLSTSPSIDDWGVGSASSSNNFEEISKVPFALVTANYSSEIELLPNSQISIMVSTSTGPNYNLCVPETSMDVYSDGMMATIYYYDNQGNPYSDNLLQHRITCPVINNYQVCDFNNDGIRNDADQAIFNDCDWYDVNGDGVFNLIDISEYGQNWDDDQWCEENMWTCAWGYQN